MAPPRPSLLRRLARRAGFDLKRFDPMVDPNLLRQGILEHHRVGLVLDGGANRGQYAGRLRAYGFGGRIISLEPGREAFEALEAAAAGDPLWEARRTAVGAKPGTARLALTENSVSSTLAHPLETMGAIPGSAVTGYEEVEVTTLAGLLGSLDVERVPTLLKLDVQGLELDALRGAGERLRDCELLELEMAFVPLYKDQPTATELMTWLAERGFRPVGVAPNTLDPHTGHLLEVDAIFAAERA